MTTLTHEEIRKREELKKLLNSELFVQALYDVRQGLGEEMLRTNDSTQREKLFYEANILNRLEGRLTEYCNELLFLEQKKKEDEAA